MEPATGMPLASLRRRSGALAYEALLLAALILALGFVVFPFLPSATVQPGFAPHGEAGVRFLSPVGQTGLLLTVLVGCGLYFMWFWTGGRFTLPMAAWRLRLMTSDGQPVRWRIALARYAASWIGPGVALALTSLVQAQGAPRWPLGFLGLNFVWALWDRERQFLHDRIAGTRLVQRPRASRRSP